MKQEAWRRIFVGTACVAWASFIVYYLFIIFYIGPYYWINKDLGPLILRDIPHYMEASVLVLGVILAVAALLGKAPLAWGLKYSFATIFAAAFFWLFFLAGRLSA